jgi:hypothetical protein
MMKATEPIWTQAASRQDRNAATLARWIMRERPADVHNQAGLLRWHCQINLPWPKRV